MQRARKLVLIPEESLKKMQEGVKSDAPMSSEEQNHFTTAKSSVQTPGDKFSRLDSEMKKILDSENYKTESDKYKEFLQVLQRYLFFVDEKRKTYEPLSNSEEKQNVMSDTYILSSVPKLYQNKTKLLLNHLKNNKARISWNENGTVFIDGEKIKNSNIIDLLNDAARSRKKVRAEGRTQFADILRTIDTPREFVGNVEFLNLSNNNSLSRSAFSKSLENTRYQSAKDSDTEEEAESSLRKSDTSFSQTIVSRKTNKSREKHKSPKTSTPISKRWKALNL